MTSYTHNSFSLQQKFRKRNLEFSCLSWVCFKTKTYKNFCIDSDKPSQLRWQSARLLILWSWVRFPYSAFCFVFNVRVEGCLSRDVLARFVSPFALQRSRHSSRTQYDSYILYYNKCIIIIHLVSYSNLHTHLFINRNICKIRVA